VTLTVASQGGQTQHVDLNWNASLSSGQNGCCTYNLYRSTSSESYGPAWATGVNGTSFTDAAISSGTTYYYVVTAFDGAAESGYSNEAAAVVP
jgi:fibronectin type 3 domain-containing protein